MKKIKDIFKNMNQDTKNKILAGGIVASIGAVIFGSYFAGKLTERNKNNYTNTTNTISSIDGTTVSNVTNNVAETTKSTGENYTIESLDVNYSSPTRETTVFDEEYNYSDGGSYVTPDATITTIRPTTDPNTVTVIETPTDINVTEGTTITEGTTSNEAQTESTTVETSTIPTNTSGVIVDDNNDPVPTTSYIEPTGSDPLPVEPTHETLSWEELYEDCEYTEVVEVPVETVDPNDPANVREFKGKAKVLSLR